MVRFRPPVSCPRRPLRGLPSWLVLAASLAAGKALALDPGQTLSVSNYTLDPAVDESGLPAYSSFPVAGPKSALDVDYCLLQRSTPIDAPFRSFVESLGAERLAEHRQWAMLVRLPDGDDTDADPADACSTLSGSGIRWVNAYRPSYKPAAELSPAATGGSLTDLLDDDGLLRLVLVLHRGEDPTEYHAVIDAMPAVTRDPQVVRG